MKSLDSYTKYKFGKKIFDSFDEKSLQQQSDIKDFKHYLIKYGYNEEAIKNRLKIDSLFTLNVTSIAYFKKYILTTTSSLEHLISLFLLYEPMPQSVLRLLFGESLLNQLCEWGILIPKGSGCYKSQVNLWPYYNHFFVTDTQFYYDLWEDTSLLFNDRVMALGLDSIGLAYSTPPAHQKTVLDLCCGSGIQGILQAAYAKKIVGVDVNPRAIRFSRFNAALNQYSNCEFIQGDLYDPIKTMQFDYILANPPFVPTIHPEKQLLYRDCNHHGEIVLQKIISKASAHLRPQGKVFIVSDFINVEKYEETLKHWWGNRGAMMMVLSKPPFNILQYAKGHIAPYQPFEQYEKELMDWMDILSTPNICSISNGMIFIEAQDTYEGAFFLKNDFLYDIDRPVFDEINQTFLHIYYIQNRATLNNQELHLHPLARLCLENGSSKGKETTAKVHFNEHPFFPDHYTINVPVYEMLEAIQKTKPTWENFVCSEKEKIITFFLLKQVIQLNPDNAV